MRLPFSPWFRGKSVVGERCIQASMVPTSPSNLLYSELLPLMHTQCSCTRLRGLGVWGSLFSLGIAHGVTTYLYSESVSGHTPRGSYPMPDRVRGGGFDIYLFSCSIRQPNLGILYSDNIFDIAPSEVLRMISEGWRAWVVWLILYPEFPLRYQPIYTGKWFRVLHPLCS